MQYEAPETIDEAIALLAGTDGSARLLAGGTDLLVQLRADLIEPELVVDVKRIREVGQIERSDGGFLVGAAVTCAEISEHEDLRRAWPGVVEAAALIGSTQIQGRATVGGNLCNGSPAADSVPALMAAGATAAIAGPGGRRDIPAEEMVTGPGQTALQPGEILLALILPSRPPRSGNAYQRFIPRTEMDIAVVGTGVHLQLDDAGVCTQARIGLGAVAERPLLAEEAADALVGTHVDDAALAVLAERVGAACRPIDDKRGTREFRIEVAGVLARRTAVIALERAKAET